MYWYDFSVIQTIVISCSYVQAGLQCDTDGGVAYSYVPVDLHLVSYSKSTGVLNSLVVS